MEKFSTMAEIFDDRKDLSLSPLAQDEILALSERGIDYRFILDLSTEFPILVQELAWLLHIKEPELIAVLRNEKSLGQKTSARLIALTEVFLISKEIFNTEKKFIEWLASRPQVFNGIRPIDYLSKELEDIRRVREILGRIKHGTYS